MPPQFSNEGIGTLLHGLCGERRAERWAALRRLATDDEAAEQVIPALVRILKDSDPTLRLTTARVLNHIGKTAVPFLLSALEDASTEFGHAILRTLAMIGPEAQTALPELIRLREHLEWGKAVSQTLEAIHATSGVSWGRTLELLLPLILAIGAFLALAHETLSWVDLLSQLPGVVREVATTWAALGVFFGLVVGFSLSGRLGAYVSAKYLGMSGACAGAYVGYLVGKLVEPLNNVLGAS